MIELQNERVKDQFTIRDYRNEDYPAIEELWTETGLSDEERSDTPESIEKSLRLGGKLLVLIHKHTHQIIGTSWMTYDGRRIHLHHFGVKQGFRNIGLGKLLTRESLKFASEMKTQIKLEVHRKNRTAVHLYRSHGFKYLGDYVVYIIRNPDEIELP